MAILSIDGVDIPAPSTFKLPRYDLDSADTRRNEEGYLQRDRIRQGVFKIELEWRSITSAELQIIDNAIAPASIRVTFPSADGMQTKTMYAGDRNAEIIRYKQNDIRWKASLNLIEY
jgi:hypothetical protein